MGPLISLFILLLSLSGFGEEVELPEFPDSVRERGASDEQPPCSAVREDPLTGERSYMCSLEGGEVVNPGPSTMQRPNAPHKDHTLKGKPAEKDKK